MVKEAGRTCDDFEDPAYLLQDSFTSMATEIASKAGRRGRGINFRGHVREERWR